MALAECSRAAGLMRMGTVLKWCPPCGMRMPLQNLTTDSLDKKIKAMQYFREVQHKIATYENNEDVQSLLQDSVRKGRIEDAFRRWQRKTADRTRR